MKCTLLLILAGLAFMAVHAESEPEVLASSLSKLFYIDLREAEICANKTAVTMEDLDALKMMLDVGIKPLADQKSIRRASCTVTCCAQAQGTMTGNKIDLEIIQMLIQKFNLPQNVKRTVNAALTVCYDEVKSIIDECDVSFAFLRCMVLESENFDV